MPIEPAKKNFSKEDELKIQEWWNKEKIYEKTRERRKNGPRFYFCDGPPYTTGEIHLGTAYNKTIKDAVLRYKSMRGYFVRDQAGWDMHGLPIEVKVEELLGIRSKHEIEDKVGIDEFVKKCREFSLINLEKMTKQFKRLGVWLNWDTPYRTIDNSYIESVWWSIKRAGERGLLYKDLRVITWCPRCETALADAEIEYKDVRDPSIYVKFKVLNEENTYILIWTTTPWTIPANLAVCVHPEYVYAEIKIDDERLILAKDLLESIVKLAGIKEYEIVKEFYGNELLGLKYEHPLRDEVPFHRAVDGKYVHAIISGTHVKLDEGTGCVHTAPGHGPDDYEIGKEYDIPIFSPVDEKGIFKEEAGKYKGSYVKKADDEIINDLREKNSLFYHGEIEHRYGHCWRCKSPIIYRATEQWFLGITKLKRKMMEEIDRVEWIPEWAGASRFKDWVRSAKDWTISRQRYWGIPLPVWICEKCNEKKIVGSLDELKKYAINFEDEIDLHRPWVDKIKLKCKCKSTMKRVPDVIDVWLDSGTATWASLTYPSKKEEFEKWWPADFITEGHDQTRGWFYSQLGAGVIALDRAPYDQVLMHGFTLDKEGKKMSKSLGNVVTPESVFERYGADVLRFYFLWTIPPWDDLHFNWDEVRVVSRMLNVLWNVYVFATTYMALDNYLPSKSHASHLREEDRWMISRINTLIKEATSHFEELQLHKVTRAIHDFILEDLSRWYIRLIRERAWIEKEDPDKNAAYYTLWYTLCNLTRLMAPFTPHVTEAIYQNLMRNIVFEFESVHMCDWPQCEEDLIDERLEEDMKIVKSAVELSYSARQKARLKLRWPVRSIAISAPKKRIEAIRRLEHILKTQANVKEVITLSEEETHPEVRTRIKPKFDVVGPKYKGKTSLIKKALEEIDGESIRSKISQGYVLKLSDGSEVKLTEEDIEFITELPKELEVVESPEMKLYLDGKITPELKSEGLAKEVIRRIQEMRKELNLSVEEMIRSSIIVKEEIREMLEENIELIKAETRSRELLFEDLKGYRKEWEINGNKYVITVQRDLEFQQIPREE